MGDTFDTLKQWLPVVIAAIGVVGTFVWQLVKNSAIIGAMKEHFTNRIDNVEQRTTVMENWKDSHENQERENRDLLIELKTKMEMLGQDIRRIMEHLDKK